MIFRIDQGCFYDTLGYSSFMLFLTDSTEPSIMVVNEGVVDEKGPLLFSRGMINSHPESKFPPCFQISL